MAKGLSGNVISELPRIGTETAPGINLSPTIAVLNNTLIKLTPNVSITLIKGSHLFRKGRYFFGRIRSKAYEDDLAIRIT